MKVRKELKELVESKSIGVDEYYFKKMTAPPLLSFLPYEAIAYLNSIATSIRYSGNINYKYEQIEKTVERYGFVQIGRGTNRVAYRHLEDPRYVLKVAVDDVGTRDNPREFINQDYLYPFVTKIFEVDPSGTVALVERVEPIRHRAEFESIADKVFELLRYWFTGKYVMEDIGSKYFMNWATRKFDGCPVLCDFPYMYELDYKKIRCQNITPEGPCNGIIDYDDGYNRLICPKCGAKYRAQELAKAVESKKIKIDKGERNMLTKQKIVVSVVRNGEKKSVTVNNNSTSVVDQRYQQAEKINKIASKNMKAHLNNMIMTEPTKGKTSQQAQLANAIRATQQARKAVTTNVGKEIEKAVEKEVEKYKEPASVMEEPVEEKVPPIKEEPVVEDVKSEGEQKPINPIIEQKEEEEAPVEEKDDEPQVAEDYELVPCREDIAEKVMQNINNHLKQKWDVQGNFIPKEEKKDDMEADYIEGSSEETEEDSEDNIEEEGVSEVEEDGVYEVEVGPSDPKTRRWQELRIFDIYGILVNDDTMYDIPDNVYPYLIEGGEDGDYIIPKNIILSDDVQVDVVYGTAYLTAKIEDDTIEDGRIDISEGDNICWESTYITFDEFLEKIGAELSKYELVDPPTGVVAVFEEEDTEEGYLDEDSAEDDYVETEDGRDYE